MDKIFEFTRPVGMAVSLACSLMLLTASPGQTGSARASQLTGIEAGREAGRRLRGEIDRRYNRLREAKQLKTNGNGLNPITDLVSKFIKPGMSLTSAEAVLSAAGFAVGKIGEHVLYPHGVYAAIDPYASRLFEKDSVVVVLQVDEKASPPRVTSLTGHIIRELP